MHSFQGTFEKIYSFVIFPVVSTNQENGRDQSLGISKASIIVIGCDEIIRQHKAACLRITALLACKEILWIGTSAGVILTMRMPVITATPTKISQLAPLIGEYAFQMQ